HDIKKLRCSTDVYCILLDLLRENTYNFVVDDLLESWHCVATVRGRIEWQTEGIKDAHVRTRLQAGSEGPAHGWPGSLRARHRADRLHHQTVRCDAERAEHGVDGKSGGDVRAAVRAQ